MNKINEYLNLLPLWQKHNLELFRAAVHEVVPGVVEDWKWNVPVFMVNGKMYFAMSAFKAHTKYDFMHNASQLADPDHLFNNGLDAKVTRGIDLREGETIDVAKLKQLIAAAIKID